MTDEKSLITQAVESEFIEIWEVFISNQRDPYILDENQFSLLKEKLVSGSKGFITFDDFGINLVYVVSYSLKSRQRRYSNFSHLYEEGDTYRTPEYSVEVRKEVSALMKRAREKLGYL